jgi:hypothetical protein
MNPSDAGRTGDSGSGFTFLNIYCTNNLVTGNSAGQILNSIGSRFVDVGNKTGTFDAGLVNAAGGNFNLLASSQARNGGVSVPWVTTDKSGAVRGGALDENIPDIGALIYQSGGSTPTISVQATTQSASELNLSPGVFTFIRTGSMVGDLTVNYHVGGTALPGVNYGSIGTSKVIPDGQASASVQVIPMRDFLATGDLTIDVGLDAGSYQIGTPNSDRVYFIDADGSPLPPPAPAGQRNRPPVGQASFIGAMFH